jgi:GR25 family glycosyltransferase involved in LPS biosynthesis
MFDFIPMSIEKDMLVPIVHEHVILQEENALAWNTPLRYYANTHLAELSEEELDQDWKLNDFFGTIIVINLPEAKERLKLITEQLHEIGIKNFYTFPAINGRKDLKSSIWKKMHRNRDRVDPNTKEGKLALDRLHQAEAGCYMSHYKAIQLVKDKFEQAMTDLVTAQLTHDDQTIRQAENKVRQYSRVLILEDDSGFGIVNKERTNVSKKGVGCLLRKALSHLPDEWDMLYLMAQASQPTKKISPHLRQLNFSWCAAAYAINYRMYGPLIEYLKKIEDPKVTKILPIDSSLASIHHLFNVYAIYPSIVYHQTGPSQISIKTYSNLWQGQPICKGKKKSPKP